jgi:hypothetical protein
MCTETHVGFHVQYQLLFGFNQIGGGGQILVRIPHMKYENLFSVLSCLVCIGEWAE